MAQMVSKLYESNKSLFIAITVLRCIDCCTQHIFRRTLPAYEPYLRLSVVKDVDYSSSVLLKES